MGAVDRCLGRLSEIDAPRIIQTTILEYIKDFSLLILKVRSLHLVIHRV